MEDSRDSSFPWAALFGIPHPIGAAPGGEPDGDGTSHQPNTSHHLSLSTHLDQMATAFCQSGTI